MSWDSPDASAQSDNPSLSSETTPATNETVPSKTEVAETKTSKEPQRGVVIKVAPADSRPDSEKNTIQKINVYLDLGRYKAALALANDLVANNSGDYQTYLLRARIYSLLERHEDALRENDRAKAVFNANKKKFSKKQRDFRLAKIDENRAITLYFWGTTLTSETKSNAVAKQFNMLVDRIKSRDKNVYRHLLGVLNAREKGSSETDMFEEKHDSSPNKAQ